MSKIIEKEKYVQFSQFYGAITNIPNYKFKVIPTFVDIGNSLSIVKSEPEYELESSSLNEFLAITGEIVNIVKTSNDILKNTKDSKKVIPKKKNHDSDTQLTYNKILNFEAQPGRFKLKESQQNKHENECKIHFLNLDKYSYVKSSIKDVSNNSNVKKKEKEKVKSLEEVLEEINSVNNKHKSKKDPDLEELEGKFKSIQESHCVVRGRLDKPAPKKDQDFEESKKMYKMAYDIHLKI